jgi:DNA-binding NtrC family response regulator
VESALAIVLCTGIDPILMQTRQLILERAGHQVVSAVDERELESACSKHQVDVVVIGQSLSPRMKPRILKLVRENCPSAAILEIHAPYGERTLAEADAWLAMPTEHPQEFVDIVNSLARKRDQRKS